MSRAVLEQVIQRAMDDESFKARIQSDPTTALSGYDLTAEERDAVTSGDQDKVQVLGVEGG